MDLIQAAGVEDSKVNLVVLRKGEKHTLSMKTQKRTRSDISELHLQADKSQFSQFGGIKNLNDELQEHDGARLKEAFNKDLDSEEPQ